MSDDIVRYDGKLFAPYLSKDSIQDKVSACAKWVDDVYMEQKQMPVVMPILNGAICFTVDVMRKSQIDWHLCPIRIQSYQGMERGRESRLHSPSLEWIQGRDILIIEDIVDTGHSMAFFQNELQKYEPNSVRIASLLLKPGKLETNNSIDFVGFEIEDDFVIGYGMDINEKGRHLPMIYQYCGEEE